MANESHIIDFGSFKVGLRQLRVFHAVAAAGGIRRSSDTLLRASSAVTRSVAALEASLGVPLFERKGRGMLLTAAGERVQVRAERITQWLAQVWALAAPRARGASAGSGRPAALEALFHAGRLIAATMLADVNRMPEVARLTGVTQPAVSAAIAKLEGALGERLFERTARGMRPTSLGDQAVVRFRQVIIELRYIEEEIAALGGVLMGMVRIGALPMVRTRVLPAAIVALAARYPQLRIRTIESPYEDLSAGLLRGEIDFIVGALRSAPGTEFATECLWQQHPALLVRRRHPLAQRRTLALADLAALPWALPRPGTPLRAVLRELCEAENQPVPVPAVETGDLALLRGLLLGSDMVTLQYPAQFAYELQAGSVVTLPIALPGPPREIGITTRRGAQLAPGAQALIDELRRQAARLDALP